MNVASPSDCSKKRPVRVTALSALARGATSSRRNQKPCARLQHPVGSDPSVHRALKGSQRVRIEARR